MRKFLFAATLLLLGATQAFSRNAGSDVRTGPWVTDVTQNGMTILWTSRNPGQAWVELADGTRIWEVFAGRRVFGRFHRITLTGLAPGEVVGYRVGGRLLEDDTNARDPRFGEEYADDWHTVHTFDHSRQTCRFTVFNDIHLQVDKFEAMAAKVDTLRDDFIFFNGDIVSAGNYSLDSLVDFSIAPLGDKAASLPLNFARGNHEGRGNNVQAVAQVYPNNVGRGFYYAFREGPVAFVVFDAGETHAKRSVAYSGAEVFEDYMNEQIAWAEKVFQEPFFKEAPVKVCMAHVPMIDHPDKNDYAIQRWMNVHMLPLLNREGFDMMIGADLHEYRNDGTGTMHNDFPIITNSNAERLTFEYAGGNIAIRIYNPAGELIHVIDHVVK